MTRVSLFSSPLLLGFEEVERLLDRAAKIPGDGYPPYNIERVVEQGSNGSSGKERLRITIAVAGFTVNDLEVTLEDRQLVIRGKQKEEEQKDYLHRGIAARQFSRAFVLADGMEIGEARLQNGLLTIEVHRIEPERLVRRITVKDLN
ncbi:Hsp20 family protein [Aestuariivirga sp.]|uniref:Hsp20 family protein n=1 Tax=Aestuariivirga sp. TaxID=2650926 RepID=UPI0039E558EB